MKELPVQSPVPREKASVAYSNAVQSQRGCCYKSYLSMNLASCTWDCLFLFISLPSSWVDAGLEAARRKLEPQKTSSSDSRFFGFQLTDANSFLGRYTGPSCGAPHRCVQRWISARGL